MGDKRKREAIQPGDYSADALSWTDAEADDSREGQIFTSTSFTDLGLHQYLASLLHSPYENGGFGITTATKVQQLAIPALLQSESRHVLVKSQTGSGKTFTYLLPIMHQLMETQPPIQRSDGTMALIVSPTRELCGQISDVLERLCKVYVRVVPGMLTGGEKKKSEKTRLRKGITILVSTPGRLLDHLQTTESFQLTNLKFVVVDEVDRLFDLGFEKPMTEIFDVLLGRSASGSKNSNNLAQRWQQAHKVVAKPQDLKIWMFSATVSERVQSVARSTWAAASSPYGPQEEVSVRVIDADRDSVVSSNSNRGNDGEDEDDDAVAGQQQSALVVPTTLRQLQMVVHLKWRLPALLCLLRQRLLVKREKVCVFVSTCDAVDYLALLLRELSRVGWPQDLEPPHRNLWRSPPGSGAASGSEGVVDFGDDSSPSLPAAAAPGLNARHPPRPVLDPLSSSGLTQTSFFGSSLSGASASSAVPVYRLHGRVPQNERRFVRRSFSQTPGAGLLLCTDVAARGLDLPSLQTIVQYDLPTEVSDYVHRIGRTARKGRSGLSVLFVLPEEQVWVSGEIQQRLAANAAPVAVTASCTGGGLGMEAVSAQSVLLEVAPSMPFLHKKGDGAAKRGASASSFTPRFAHVDELCALALQKHAEAVVAQNPLLTQCATQAFQAACRAYPIKRRSMNSASSTAAEEGVSLSLRRLHLGHFAKSFGLREAPSKLELSNTQTGRSAQRKQRQGDKEVQMEEQKDVLGAVLRGEYASAQWRLRQRAQRDDADKVKKRKRDETARKTDGDGVGDSDQQQDDDKEDADSDNDKDDHDEEDSAQQTKKKQKQTSSEDSTSSNSNKKRRISQGQNLGGRSKAHVRKPLRAKSAGRAKLRMRHEFAAN